MLQRKIQNKIINKVSKLLPESEKLDRLHTEIELLLREATFSVLTEGERNLVEKRPQLVKTLSKLRLHVSNDSLKKLPGYPKFSLKFKIGDEIRTDVITFDVSGRSDKDIDCPNIFDSYYFSDWIRVIEQRSVTTFESIWEKLVSYLTLKKSWFDKLFLLEMTLDSSDITLTDLRKYYPELYKIAKDGINSGDN